MTNILYKTALRYRELARDISNESARREILRIAAEYEERAVRLFAPHLEAEPSAKADTAPLNSIG